MVYPDESKCVSPRAERLIVVSEWQEDCVGNQIKSSKYAAPSSLSRLTQQILSALSYLEEKGITHRTLTPNNILITPEV